MLSGKYIPSEFNANGHQSPRSSLSGFAQPWNLSRTQKSASHIVNSIEMIMFVPGIPGYPHGTMQPSGMSSLEDPGTEKEGNRLGLVNFLLLFLYG